MVLLAVRAHLALDSKALDVGVPSVGLKHVGGTDLWWHRNCFEGVFCGTHEPSGQTNTTRLLLRSSTKYLGLFVCFAVIRLCWRQRKHWPLRKRRSSTAATSYEYNASTTTLKKRSGSNNEKKKETDRAAPTTVLRYHRARRGFLMSPPRRAALPPQVVLRTGPSEEDHG